MTATKEEAPLFPLGYGLTSKDMGNVAALDIGSRPSADLLGLSRNHVFFAGGRTPAPWRAYLGDAVEPHRRTAGEEIVVSAAGGLTYATTDWQRQADSKLATWNGSAPGSILTLGYKNEDFTEELERDQALVLQIRVHDTASEPVIVSMGHEDDHSLLDISRLLGESDSWQHISIPLACFVDAGTDMSRVTMPFKLQTSGTLSIQIADIRLGEPVGKLFECVRE